MNITYKNYMRQKLFMLLAAVLLSSASAFAQSGNGESLRGDVNEDGVVNIADIAAVLKIMKDNGGTSGETIYYWYVGQTDPSTMTSISPIVTDNSSPGWRLIGTTLPNYSSSNKLWDDQITDVNFDSTNYWYVAIPNNSTAIVRDGLGNDGTHLKYLIVFAFCLTSLNEWLNG